MNRKSTTKAAAKSSVFDTVDTPDSKTGGAKEPTPEKAKTPNIIAEAPCDDQFELIIERGVAEKLSPKSNGKIYFQLARNKDDSRNYLRIIGNDGGGLHSKEWIALEKIISHLSGVSESTFKSSALKDCMIGKSSNNVSFLAATLRSPLIKLIKSAEGSPFTHQLDDGFDKTAAALIERKP